MIGEFPERERAPSGDRTDMIVVAYGSKHGSTCEVATAVAEVMRRNDLAAVAKPALSVGDLSPFSGVVLGTSIYTGRLHVDVLRFIERHRGVLADLPLAIFGLGPRTLDADDVEHSRIQLLKALREFPELEPVSIAVFGGVVDPTVLRWPFNRMQPSDARDWTAIRGWAADLAECPRFGKTASAPRDLHSTVPREYR